MPIISSSIRPAFILKCNTEIQDTMHYFNHVLTDNSMRIWQPYVVFFGQALGCQWKRQAVRVCVWLAVGGTEGLICSVWLAVGGTEGGKIMRVIGCRQNRGGWSAVRDWLKWETEGKCCADQLVSADIWLLQNNVERKSAECQNHREEKRRIKHTHAPAEQPDSAR